MRILTLPRFAEAVYQMSEFIRRLQDAAARNAKAVFLEMEKGL